MMRQRAVALQPALRSCLSGPSPASKWRRSNGRQGVSHSVSVRSLSLRDMLEAYLAERSDGGSPWSRNDVYGCGAKLPDLSNAASWIRCVGRAS